MITTIIILSILLIVSVFVNINQLRTQESQAEYIAESNSKIKQLDRLGSFESDDETGFIFQEMKEIFDSLNKGF